MADFNVDTCLITEEILIKQSDRAISSIEKHLSINITPSYAKRIVANIYGFDDWNFVSHHLRTSIYKERDARFNFIELHPDTIHQISPEVITYLNTQKSILKSIMEVDTVSNDFYSNDKEYELCEFVKDWDSLDFILANMYGFDHPLKVISNVKYHFFEGFVSLYDEKNPWLIIKNKTDIEHIESIKEMIVYHQDFGPVLTISPREMFENEMENNDIKSPDSIKNQGPFSNWNVRRLFDLFKDKINKGHGDSFHKINAIRLSEIAVTLFLTTSKTYSASDFMKCLSLRTLAKVPYIESYPKNIRILVKSYLDNLPGTPDNMGIHMEHPKIASEYHKQTSMILSEVMISLISYFEHIGQNSNSMQYLIDASSIQDLKKTMLVKNSDKDLDEIIITEFINMPDKSMIFIKANSEDIDEKFIEFIQRSAIQKKSVICWLCNGEIPKQIDKKLYSKLTINPESNKFKYKLITMSGEKKTWTRTY